MKRVYEINDNNKAKKIEKLLAKFHKSLDAFPPGSCPISIQLSLLKTARAQTCGKCTPCREGLVLIEKFIEKVLDGKATIEDFKSIKNMAAFIRDTADCANGYEPARAFIESMEDFEEEYISHIENKCCSYDVKDKIPCTHLCPAHVDIPGYIALIGNEDYAGTINLIRKDNPFPTACAYICEHPCETHCKRQIIDDALNIRGLKKFAVDQISADKVQLPKPLLPTGKNVAIIGGGPSGLTTAFFLSLMGHNVVIFEENEKLGGMLRYGIPSYRFPKERLDEDIKAILSTGNIEVKYNISVGKDITIEELYENFDAVYIAVGAQAGKKLKLEGCDASNVFSAVEMLRQVGYGNYPDYSGKKVVVIGGGNVAMDCARTAIRCNADEVSIVYRRRKDDMTALDSEIEGAIAEGAELLTLQSPYKIEKGENGECVALWTKPQMISSYDSAGRPRPVDANKEPIRIPCDVILIAIGQDIVSEPFEKFGIKTNRNRLETSKKLAVDGKEGIFAGGDCVTGPSTVINAIAAGKIAAYNIDSYLGFNNRLNFSINVPDAKLNDPTPTGRVNITERPARERKNDFKHVENPMSYEEAMQETSRCLRCDRYGWCIPDLRRD